MIDVSRLDESNAEMLNNQNDQTNITMDREAQGDEEPINELDEIPEFGQAPEYPTDDEPEKKEDKTHIDLEADGANHRQRSNESGGVLAKA